MTGARQMSVAYESPDDRDDTRACGMGQAHADERPLVAARACAPWPHSEMKALITALEADVIPSLARAHGRDEDERRDHQNRLPGPGDIAHLTSLLLEDDVSGAAAFLQEFGAHGTSLDVLLLELFAPTARRLGDMWMTDECTFGEVTLCVGRLQQLLRQFAMGQPHVAATGPGRRVLLAPTPGEQHTFGMLMVGEFLRRDGWDVTGEPAASRAELCGIVHEEWFGVIGLSLYSDRHLAGLKRDIRAIRRASRNDRLGVLVGGRIFTENPMLVAQVGADATAVDGREATRRAMELLKQTAAAER